MPQSGRAHAPHIISVWKRPAEKNLDSAQQEDAYKKEIGKK